MWCIASNKDDWFWNLTHAFYFGEMSQLERKETMCWCLWLMNAYSIKQPRIACLLVLRIMKNIYTMSSIEMWNSQLDTQFFHSFWQINNYLNFINSLKRFFTILKQILNNENFYSFFKISRAAAANFFLKN